MPPGTDFAHEVFSGRTRLLPEVTMLGWLHFRQTVSGFMPASQHDRMEIYYLRRGRLRWQVGGAPLDLRPGSVLIIPPGCPRRGDQDALQPCELFWLRLDWPSGPTSWPGLSYRQTRTLRQGFAAPHAFLGQASPEIETFFRLLLDTYRQPGQTARLQARSLLHTLLVFLLRDRQNQNTAPLGTDQRALPGSLHRAIQQIHNDFAEPDFSLDHVARAAGLSRMGLRRQFLQGTGCRPLEYLTQVRIQAARERLENSAAPVTRIAFDVGFASSQYFATVFRRQVGLTPMAYRRQIHRQRSAGTTAPAVTNPTDRS